ncbi:MAG: response regulator [Isosphaeraceae bacterium]|nr:response regulator [Isosphaeraceae bacterium]
MSAVLIVDDSPMDRALFRTILNRAGYDVHEVSLGREVPSKVREFRPHVIILDVNLPDTDGHTVCRALRADPVCVGVPILMLTVRDNESDILAGLEAGADDYVAKDAAAEIFLARVRRLVRYRQMATTSVLNEQLAQVGRLLTGIVHEIRGPLSVIRGNAELLRMALGEDHPSRQWTDPILRSCQLLQARLEHLMAAVRSGPPILQELEVPPLVREAADLFRKGIDLRAGNIKIDLDLAEGLPPVRADAGRLMQVLLNLLSNAYEAILASRPEGRIVIRARRSQAEGREAVEVEVRDDGPGIPEVHLGRIFEPFFTTKEGGSGYGLYLASEILREHGGLLTACNDEQGGACFTIRLPLAEASSLA